MPMALQETLDLLEGQYGHQSLPRIRDPWQMILWENVAYMANDERREEGFRALQKRVGTRPEQVLSAAEDVLLDVTSHGIVSETFAAKLRLCAKICLQAFAGDVRQILKWPLPKAKKALQKFPGIGEPGAEKILLFSGVLDVLALESNGLRVLVRFGLGEDRKSYAATYKSVREVTIEELPAHSKSLTKAHLLLRRHGQELCLRNGPLCHVCVVNSDCPFFHRLAKQ